MSLYTEIVKDATKKIIENNARYVIYPTLGLNPSFDLGLKKLSHPKTIVTEAIDGIINDSISAMFSTQALINELL